MNKSVIENGLELYVATVIKLNSKEGVERFSVAARMSPEIVTVFSVRPRNPVLLLQHRIDFWTDASFQLHPTIRMFAKSVELLKITF